MSHFSVLVIGPDVDEQLAPYHEFESTGTDDKYVKTIDKTAEYRKIYESSTEDMLREIATGQLHSFFTPAGEWDSRFSRPETEGIDAKLGRKNEFVPPGFEQIKVPTPEVESFAKFIEGWAGHKVVPFGEQPDLAGEHKFGYTLVDSKGEVIASYDRTNPNKKWDWYVVGGRWSGFFKLKPEWAHVAAQNLGEPGTFGRHTKDLTGRADFFTKRMIDIEGMRKEAMEKAGVEWDRSRAVLAASGVDPVWEPWPTSEWFDANPKIDIKKVRDTYHAQPAIAAFHADDKFSRDHWQFDEFRMSREQYVKRARDYAIATYAVVCKGEWVARGEMGWFGCDDKMFDSDEWASMLNELIENLPDDTMLTVVDAHI